jgi:Ca2+-binding RTX toxin-like protein
MTTINVSDASNERVEFYNMTAGSTIDVTATDTTNTTVEVVYADDTSATDSQTFIVAAATADDNVALVIDDIDTINISSDTAAQVDLTLAGVSMTAATARNTVNFTGTNDIELIATGADVTTINASGMGTGGALVQTGRSATEASTYTGSAGNDTFIMMHANDAVNGGAGTGDTLDINMVQAVGTAIIDLSAADQIASFNGGVNSPVQTGFENIDLAGLTLNGAVVTGTSAANTIVGSGLVDQIDAGGGVDTITSGAGADTVTGGAGIDTFVFDGAAANADTVTDFVHGATGDVMDFTTNTLITLDAKAAQSQLTSAGAGNFNVIAATSTAAVAHDTGDIVILSGTTATVGTATLIAAEFGAGQGFEAVLNGDNLIVLAANSTTGNTLVYEALESANATLTAGELTLIGTLEGVSAADATLLTAENFGL